MTSTRTPRADAQRNRARLIDAAHVAGLKVRWRFRIPIAAVDSGALTANPVVKAEIGMGKACRPAPLESS